MTKAALSNELNVFCGLVCNMIKRLSIRKLSSCFVPYFLTQEMGQQRLQCCENDLHIFETVGDCLLDNVITEDETLLSLYLPEDRCSSQEFKFLGEHGSRKLRSGTSHRRTPSYSLIHIDFVDPVVKINASYYSNLEAEAKRKRRKPRGKQLHFLHNNALSTLLNLPLGKSIQFQWSRSLTHPIALHLKRRLGGHRLVNDEGLHDTSLNLQLPQFYKTTFQYWCKCV